MRASGSIMVIWSGEERLFTSWMAGMLRRSRAPATAQRIVGRPKAGKTPKTTPTTSTSTNVRLEPSCADSINRRASRWIKTESPRYRREASAASAAAPT